MSERVLCMLKRNGLHCAAIFTEQGLYASSLPRKSSESALASVGGAGLRASLTEEHRAVLSSIFDIYEGVAGIDTSAIRMDFSDLTVKQIAVLKEAMKIPYGKVMSYGKVAMAAGIPGGARFVGNVMASNRFAPIVPCHRVVAANGIGGYGGSLGTKIMLLRREGVARSGLAEGFTKEFVS